MWSMLTPVLRVSGKLQASIVLALSTAVSACAGGAGFTAYRYAGIDLGAGVDGRLERNGGCIVVVSTQNERVVPIWPIGTKVTPDSVRLPQANGGEALALGSSVTLTGGYTDDRGGDQSRYVQRCGDRAFLVNRGQGWHVGTHLGATG